MSRAARLLAGATLVGVSACSSTTQSNNVAPPYGTPPRPDAGVVDRNVDGGAGGAQGSDGATDTGDAPSDDAAD